MKGFIALLLVVVIAATTENYDPYKEQLIELDASTEEARIVLPQFMNALYVTDSTLYYFEPDLTSLDYRAASLTPGFREYDVESGTVKDCGLPVADALWVRYDEEYIYVLGFPKDNGEEKTLYILSRNYELLDQTELKNGLQIYAIASDRIYFFRRGANAPISCYIEKSQIGSHNLTLPSIETVG